MVKPYYEESGITIYHADCRDVLPQLDAHSIDLLLTDPPYPHLKGGVALDPAFTTGVGRRREGMHSIGQPWGNDLSGITLACPLVRLGALVFCSFKSLDQLPALLGGEKVALVTWYARNSLIPIHNVPHYQTEFIWAVKYAPGLKWRSLKTWYDIPRLPGGCIATERYQEPNGASSHPTQKPLALLRSLLTIQPTSVIDPYMGTGTTLQAAKELGMTCIGIEINERYCEIATNRLRQEVFSFIDQNSTEIATPVQMTVDD